MKKICDTLNDINSKIKIYNLEKDRLEKNKEFEKAKNIDIEILNLVNTKNKYLNILSDMDGIEYRLYSYLLKGYNPTKAIAKVAEENYLKDMKPNSERQIIKYYNNMIKKYKLQ